jgi:F-type H+-transporting ATPase subunit c
MLYFMALALAAGIGVPLAALGGALGQGKAASSALESMARQPEMMGRLQVTMIIAFAFIESLVIFSLLVFFLLNMKMPNTDKVMDTVRTSAASGK